MRLTFNFVRDQLRLVGYEVEKIGYNKGGPYEVFSQVHHPGMTAECDTLEDVWNEFGHLLSQQTNVV